MISNNDKCLDGNSPKSWPRMIKPARSGTEKSQCPECGDREQQETEL
jgi:hypothetical protein